MKPERPPYRSFTLPRPIPARVRENRSVGFGPASDGGFTLIETLAILLLIGVISVYAFSRITGNTTDHILQKDLLIQHLRHTQLRAMGDDTAWYIRFDATAPTYGYQLFRDGDAAAKPLPGEETDTVTLASGVSLTLAAPALISFDTWGRPATDSDADTLQAGNRSVTFSQGAGSSTLTLTQNTGYIR